MTRSKRKKQDKYAKHKLIAIPVLLGVLAFVLWDGSAKSSAAPAAAEANPSPPQTQTVAEADSVGEGEVVSVSKQLPWPKPDLSFLEGPNPFSSFTTEEKVEEPLKQPEESKDHLVSKEEVPVDVQQLLQEVAQELTQQTDSFAFSSSRRKVIVFGDREYSVGDEVRDGVFLKSISGDQVELEYRRRTRQID